MPRFLLDLKITVDLEADDIDQAATEAVDLLESGMLMPSEIRQVEFNGSYSLAAS